MLILVLCQCLPVLVPVTVIVIVKNSFSFIFNLSTKLIAIHMYSDNSSESNCDNEPDPEIKLPKQQLFGADRDAKLEQQLLEQYNLTKKETTIQLVPPVTTSEIHSWLHRNDVIKFLHDKQDGDARLLFALYGSPKRIVYDRDEKEWYLWDGQHWNKNTPTVNICARTFIRDQYRNLLSVEEENKGDQSLQKCLKTRASQLGTHNYIKGVIALARDLFSVDSTAWNRHPYMFPTKNGVVHLKLDSKVRFEPAHPEFMIKSHAPTEWKGLATPAPRWKKFLTEVYKCEPNTRDMVAYIHRLFGYMIYGEPREHVFPIFYGEKGRTGRSTIFSHVLPCVIGDTMLQAVSPEVVMSAQQAKAGSAHPHLMALKSSRIAYLSESEKGGKLNISQIKRLAGGDLVTARQNYGAMETWAPTHVLSLLTNHKPDVGSGDDTALWERIHLIPHTQRFVDVPNPSDINEHKKDPYLVEALQAEAPGILAWFVMGCLIWQQCGLDVPQMVKNSTQEFRSVNSQMVRFLGSCPKQTTPEKIQAQELYQTYKEWCSKNHETEATIKVFGSQIKEYLGNSIKSHGKMYYSSIYCFNPKDHNECN
jgi:putative DNA primase/helicase